MAVAISFEGAMVVAIFVGGRDVWEVVAISLGGREVRVLWRSPWQVVRECLGGAAISEGDRSGQVCVEAIASKIASQGIGSGSLRSSYKRCRFSCPTP